MVKKLLIINKAWEHVSENGKEVFCCTIAGLSSVEVYDYTDMIEKNGFKVVWHQDIYNVISFGVKTNYASGKFYFYIETEPLME